MSERWFVNKNPSGAIDFSLYIEAQEKENIAKKIIANPSLKQGADFNTHISFVGAEQYAKEYKPEEP